MPIFRGSQHDDTLYGTTGHDTIEGGAGDDVIVDEWGNDTIDGGDGDDTIIDRGGSNIIRGGAGNDRIIVTDFISADSGNAGFWPQTNIIEGGSGADYVTIEQLTIGSVTIDLGDGDDVIEFYPWLHADQTITLGQGRDQIFLTYEFGDATRLNITPAVITDFATGDAGDVLNLGEFLRGYFHSGIAPAAYDFSNPFSNGVLILTQSGADTLVQVDYGGSENYANPIVTIMVLQNVDASSLTAANFGGFSPAGGTPSRTTLNGTANNDLLVADASGSIIDAGDGNDRILGSGGNDLIAGGAGNDIITGGGGDDTLRGGDGNDVITDNFGNDTIEGGAGNDRIDISRGPIARYDPALHEILHVNGGTGDDYVRIEMTRDGYAALDHRTATLIADLGDGDDTIEITSGIVGGLLPQSDLTLGAGRDTVIIESRPQALGQGAQIVIQDFETGESGDVLMLARSVAFSSGWDFVGNPFASGHLTLLQSGADTIVVFDGDGSGGGSGEGFSFELVRLVGIDASTLTAANFNGYDPSGAESRYLVAAGTTGDDHIIDSYRAETINGGDGNDLIEILHGGSDHVDGGGGDDRIIIDTGYAPTGYDYVIAGGAGNDHVEVNDLGEGLNQQHSVTIDLGAGDDRLTLNRLAWRGTVVTLGSGRDVIEYTGFLTSQHNGGLRITDFQAGDNGDVFDWNLFATGVLFDSAAVFQHAGLPDFNPFVEGLARLVKSGDDTLLQVRTSAHGTEFVTLVTFENTSPRYFTQTNLGFDPNRPTLVGSGRNDTLSGGDEHDVIFGGDGNDLIEGLAGDDNLFGDAGNDTLRGGDGNDWLDGGDGVDTLEGGDGDDSLRGREGADHIFGGNGNDEILDEWGTDIIDGGTGDDRIYVNRDYRVLTYPPGSVSAGDGNDIVTIQHASGGEAYSVDLGAGDDVLITDGGFGSVTLGTGRDTVRFVVGPRGDDPLIVTDFEPGDAGDVFDLAQVMGRTLHSVSMRVDLMLSGGANPFALGVLELRQDGNDVQLILIPEVSGLYADELVATFQNTTVESFTTANFAGYDPHASPALPTYVSTDLTIAPGEVLTGSGIAITALVTDGSVHIIQNGRDADFINSGMVETFNGLGRIIGFGVSRYHGGGDDAWFHNTETGRFIVEQDTGLHPDQLTTTYSFQGGNVFGYYAGQQATNFLNDGYFAVRADSFAVGIVSGYDVFNYRQIINNGTIEVSSQTAAIGLRLGRWFDFSNSGDITVTAPIFATGLFVDSFVIQPISNSGSIIVRNDPGSDYYSYGIALMESSSEGRTRIIENSGILSADIAIITYDTSPPGQSVEHVINTGVIDGVMLLGSGDDAVINRGGEIYGAILLEDGDDLYDGIGGFQWGGVYGGAGNDTYRIDSLDVVLVEDAGAGYDTVESTLSYTLGANFEGLTLLGSADIDATGNNGFNILRGNSGSNMLTGGRGDDTLDGGGNIDTAIVSGNRSAYTVTQLTTGVFRVVGPDGTDTLSNVEFLQFDDQTIRLLPGTGTTVDFSADSSASYMGAIHDFDGNSLGGNGSWLRIGSADVNGDGDIDQILVNREIGRFATVGTAPDGLVYFDDYSWAGETRVVGIYIDPLVASGDVVQGSAFDSQQRFQNDLNIENINRVLGANDYDHDGLQEVYFALTDGTAYLHAYMHADGNIQYANYQSQQQVIDYLTANGFSSSTWADWFPGTAMAATVHQAAAAPTAAIGDGGYDSMRPVHLDSHGAGWADPASPPGFWGEFLV